MSNLRLIHTSDWHLGQTLHNFERSYEHTCFLNWLLDTLETEQADALLIAGDLFDTANPSAAAQQQLYRFLTDARARVPHLTLVLIAGNHDSPARMETPSPFLDMLDATVVGQVRRLADGGMDLAGLVVPLKDKQGDIAAWCLAIPFLRPGDLPRVEDAENPYLEAVTRLHHQVCEHALALRQPGQVLVAMGHCHMSGGAASEDSERRIVIGGSEALPARLFEPEIAYAALGHLHLAQTVGGDERLRYCGSPIPLSFAETTYPHQVLRVDLDGERAVAIEPLRIPRFIDLLRVPLKPAPLDEVLLALEALDVPDVLEYRQPYLEVRVQLGAPEPGLRSRIEAALEGKPVRLAKIDIRYARHGEDSDDPLAALSLDELNALQPLDIFRELYRRKYADELPGSVLDAFGELLHASDVPVDA